MGRWIYWWRGFLVVGGMAVAWISLTYGLGGYYADRVVQGRGDLVDHALAWRPDHASVGLQRALRLFPEDPEQGVGRLQELYLANPTAPMPLVLLAARMLEEGQGERADALIDVASRLAPVDPLIQGAIASYWAARGRYNRTVEHWSTILEADRSREADLFPSLLAVAEDPATRSLLEPLVASAPSWWSRFFRNAARNSTDLDTVRFLYALRRQALREPVAAEERAAFVERLQKDGAIAEAYLVWLSGLDETARNSLGFVFDGGFDLPIDGGGFGWRVVAHPQFAATPMPTGGASGRGALRIRFGGFEGPFRHVSQPLFLDAGTYRLSGRVRLDRLISRGGVQWIVQCVLPEAQLLGEGPAFLGSSDWREFDLYFEVPDSCTYQRLNLVAAGRNDVERTLDGIVWFDDIKIVRADALDAAARADALLQGSASDLGGIETSEPRQPSRSRPAP